MAVMTDPIASETPVVPRPAATVVLLRPAGGDVGDAGIGDLAADGDGALEVLLTRRPSTMAFAADMHVFPGGRVDPADADPRLVARSARSAASAVVALGGDLDAEPALAAFIAAVRETFEETGVLLAEPDPGADSPTTEALDVARAEVLHVPGAFAPMVEALGLRLRTDLLVPLSRWVTPPGLPRRFDARFFAAALPAGAEVSLLGDEVVAHAWHTPRAALDAMAAGRLAMWLPTSSTLQQLEHAPSIDAIGARLAPGRLGTVVVEDVMPGVVRIEMPAGGGVAGQPVHAYLVGTGPMVLVDPGDPTGDGLERALAIAQERGATIAAVALTHADPDHAAGAEAIREQLGVPVQAGPRAGRDLPYPVEALEDEAVIDAGAMHLHVVATPGPAPEHVAFIVDGAGGEVVAVLTGDLDGVRGARSMPGPSDAAAWTASIERVRALAPGVPWFGGHPRVEA